MNKLLFTDSNGETSSQGIPLVTVTAHLIPTQAAKYILFYIRFFIFETLISVLSTTQGT